MFISNAFSCLQLRKLTELEDIRELWTSKVADVQFTNAAFSNFNYSCIQADAEVSTKELISTLTELISLVDDRSFLTGLLAVMKTYMVMTQMDKQAKDACVRDLVVDFDNQTVAMRTETTTALENRGSISRALRIFAPSYRYLNDLLDAAGELAQPDETSETLVAMQQIIRKEQQRIGKLIEDINDSDGEEGRYDTQIYQHAILPPINKLGDDLSNPQEDLFKNEAKRFEVLFEALHDNSGDISSAFYSILQPEDVVEGEVKAVENGIASIDLNGVTGYLPARELTWKHLPNPTRAIEGRLQKGQIVQCKITHVDRLNKHIQLSIRQLNHNPYQDLQEGEIVKVRIKKTIPVGAFGTVLNLNTQIDGFIHISEISDQWIRTPEDVIEVGQVLDARVIYVNDEEKRLRLSIKQVQKPDSVEGFLEHLNILLEDS